VLGAALLAWYSFELSPLRDTVVQSAKDEVNTPLFGARHTPKELGYTDNILDSDLLEPGPLFAQEAEARGLQFQFMAHGFNHQSALVINLHNANDEGSISINLPAGMLLAPAERRDMQNLMLRNAVNVRLSPGETRRIEQWAFCGNQYHLPPVSEEMKPTGWILNAPPCQSCVWRATLPYETAVPAVEGNWMAAKLGAALVA